MQLRLRQKSGEQNRRRKFGEQRRQNGLEAGDEADCGSEANACPRCGADSAGRGAANYGSHPNVAIRIACVNIYIGIFLKEAGTVNGSTSVFFFKDAASVNNFLEITNQAKQ